MRKQTAEFLSELEDVDWFHAVGEPPGANVIAAPSWEHAIAFCAAPEWQEVQMEAANHLTAQLSRNYRERYREWNKVVLELKPILHKLIDENVRPYLEAEGLPKAVFNCVSWDLLHAATEREYSDLCEPGFFHLAFEWYKQGHFPCGWSGNFPEGKLIVF